MCRLRNIAMCDYQESVTTEQTVRWTDRCQTKLSLCAAMLHTRHKNENCNKMSGPKGHCRSPEYNECVKNLTFEWNQKQQHFVTHASRSLLCIQFVAVAFQSSVVKADYVFPYIYMH